MAIPAWNLTMFLGQADEILRGTSGSRHRKGADPVALSPRSCEPGYGAIVRLSCSLGIMVSTRLENATTPALPEHRPSFHLVEQRLAIAISG